MTETGQSPALTMALAYHRAWTSGDLDGAMAHVADDVTCHAPGRVLSGKDAYRTFLHGFSQVMTGLTDVAAFGDREHAVLFYYPHTAVTSSAPAAEHFTVGGGKITATLLVFDRLSYAPPPVQQQS